jgi:outer membrane protein TolC
LHSKGLAPEYQVRQTEGALAQVQATIPVLNNGLDAAMNALDVMLGTPPGTHRAQLASPGAISYTRNHRDGHPGGPASPQTRYYCGRASSGRIKRPYWRGCQRVLSKVFPNALLGSATTVSGDNLFTAGASQSAGVLGLRWRLFDFGRINAQIEQAKGQEAEALAAYRLSVLRATEDVENAFSALVNRQIQTATLTGGETALASARQSTFIAFQQGTASLIDVLHNDETLLQASDARAQAQTESAQAAVAAFTALGGGWQSSLPGEIANKPDKWTRWLFNRAKNCLFK